MTYENILSDIKKKVYYPIYFLMGEEPYYIDKISDFIEENILNASEKEFNQSVLYGKDIDIPTIISHAKRFPMMSNHQVVIIKEAQNLTKIDDLNNYIENPQKSTILVICYKYKTYDKRKTLTKTIEKKGVLFESKKLADNKLAEWVTSYVHERKYTINSRAAELLSEYLGNDLSKIANELDKLIINVPQKTEIKIEHIEQNIGISKDFNIFELTNAIGKKDVLKANQIINYFASNPKNNPLVLSISNIYAFFMKLWLYHNHSRVIGNLGDKKDLASVLGVHPYFLTEYQKSAANYNIDKIEAIFSLIREYDLKSKGVDCPETDDGELLKELVYRIIH